jgi:hypothetical protein
LRLPKAEKVARAAATDEEEDVLRPTPTGADVSVSTLPEYLSGFSPRILMAFLTVR